MLEGLFAPALLDDHRRFPPPKLLVLRLRWGTEFAPAPVPVWVEHVLPLLVPRHEHPARCPPSSSSAFRASLSDAEVGLMLTTVTMPTATATLQRLVFFVSVVPVLRHRRGVGSLDAASTPSVPSDDDAAKQEAASAETAPGDAHSWSRDQLGSGKLRLATSPIPNRLPAPAPPGRGRRFTTCEYRSGAGATGGCFRFM